MTTQYMTIAWQRLHDPKRQMDPAFRRHLMEIARPHQATFSALMVATEGNPVGFEMKRPKADKWAFIASVPNGDVASEWRVYIFDRNGFICHNGHATLQDAAEELTREFTVMDLGALDRVSQDAAWKMGMALQEIRDDFIVGRIGYEEMVARAAKVSAEHQVEEEVA